MGFARVGVISIAVVGAAASVIVMALLWFVVMHPVAAAQALAAGW